MNPLVVVGAIIGYAGASAYKRWNEAGWTPSEMAENAKRNLARRWSPGSISGSDLASYLSFIDSLPVKGGE